MSVDFVTEGDNGSYSFLNGSIEFSDSYFESAFYEYHKPEKIAMLCIYVPVFFLALIGNSLVLVMVCINKRFRRNIANFFLVNLAIADLLVTLFCIPLTIGQHVYSPWIYGEFLCKSIGFLQGIYVEGSVLTILCMSAERYLAIRHPMKMRSICDQRRVKQIIILTWIISIIVMCPLAIYKKIDEFNVVIDKIYFCREEWPSHRRKLAYEIFLFFIVYIIPGTVTCALYTMIGCSLWRQDHNLQRANSSVNNDARVIAGRRKLARMMIIISILFAICWLPYFVINLCLIFLTETTLLMSLYPYALLLGHSNSAQNPILYCFMHRGFHDFVWRIIRCQCNQLRSGRQQANSESAYSTDKTKMTSIRVLNGRTNDEKKRLMVQISDPV